MNRAALAQQSRGIAHSRIFWSICIVAFFPTPAVAQEGALVRVGVYENIPKVGTDTNGNPEGIFIDIIEEIATSEGWTLTYVHGTWQEGLDRLARGELDLMPDVAFTADRERLYAFHQEPVLSSWSQVYARQGTEIRSLPDLDGQRVAVLDGSMQQELFSSVVDGFGFDVTLVSLPDFAEAFRAVADERADAVVTNRFYGVRHYTEFGLVDTAIIFGPSQLFFAAPRDGDPALFETIDRHLRRLKRDTTSEYYRSLRRWSVHEAPPVVPSWLLWSMLAVAAMLFFSLLWIATLRRTAARLRESDTRQRQLVAELAVARDEAEAADRIKSAFLASMSHELRTPLNSIIGFSGILLQELAGPLNEEQAKQLGMVRGSAEHLLALITDVLDLSRIEAGQLQIDVASFDLRESIERVIDAVRPQAEKKELDIEVDLGDVGLLESDQQRVEQVVLNLLSNSIKFTDDGSIYVEATLESEKVEIRVTDTGQGIKEEDQKRLFRPFLQLDSGLSRRYEGTGLGLSICKRLVDLLGGSIWVTSEWGRGSTFGFELPTEKGGKR